MAEWKNRLLRSGTAMIAATLLFAAPMPAAAQWWEDEEAYEYGDGQGLFTDYDYYDDYGYGGGLYDDEVAMTDGADDGMFGDNDGIVGEEAGLDTEYERDTAGYYDNDFEDEGWFDWF